MNDSDPARRFDFLEGEWTARCRVPRSDGSWDEDSGRLSARRILGGAASLEFFEGRYHGGRIEGVGLRAFNRATSLWEHTWTDSGSPGNFHVWKGAFTADRIDLHADWIDENGARVRSRLTWSDIQGDRLHWESARAVDAGPWRLHWVIDFERVILSP
jgi:hypothetical protein